MSNGYDFTDSIRHIERKFRDGTYGFFMNTIFGRIAVEEVTEDFDPMNPVTVTPWEIAPASNFCIRNSHVSADYYLAIGNSAIRKFPRHIHIIEGMFKVMFSSMLGTVPNEDVIDAAVTVYVEEYENRRITMNQLVSEFLYANVGVFGRMNSMVDQMAEKIIRLRIEASEKVLREAQDILQHNIVDQEYMMFFVEPFYRDIFGIMLYCIKHDPTLQLNFKSSRYYGILIEDEHQVRSYDGNIIMV